MKRIILALALALALLFLAACSAGVDMNPPEETTAAQTTVVVPENVTVFEKAYPDVDLDEIWMRDEATGEETLLLAPRYDHWWVALDERINERFFVFAEGSMFHRDTMFYDLALQRVIRIETTGQAHPTDFLFDSLEDGRIYMNMGHSGKRSFDIAQLESGEPIVIDCDAEPVFLVTGELDDVREIEVRICCCHGGGDHTLISLSSAQQAELFTQLRNAYVLMLQNPLHHSYGAAQMSRRFLISVQYEDGRADAIYVGPNAFRWLEPESSQSFVIAAEVEELIAFLDNIFV